MFSFHTANPKLMILSGAFVFKVECTILIDENDLTSKNFQLSSQFPIPISF